MEVTLPLDAEPGDERNRGAREFDLLFQLLTGGEVPGQWHAEVIVPFSVADGGDLELAEIPGLGPILPSTARDLLEQADTIAQTAVDQDGHVIATGDPIRARREQHEPTPQPAPTPAPGEAAPEQAAAEQAAPEQAAPEQ